MQVAEQRDSRPRLQLRHECLQAVNGGVHVGVRGVPVPVQVVAMQGGAVVAVDDTVGVQHGNHLNTGKHDSGELWKDERTRRAE